MRTEFRESPAAELERIAIRLQALGGLIASHNDADEDLLNAGVMVQEYAGELMQLWPFVHSTPRERERELEVIKSE